MCFIHVLVLRVGCQAKYTGMIHCFRKVMAEEGFTGLYRGALSPIAGAMAHNANVFFSYSLAKKVVGSIHHRDHTDLTIAQLFAAGSMAGAVISVVETPVDLFKIKLQRQGLHVRAWHGCRRAVHTACSPTRAIAGFLTPPGPVHRLLRLRAPSVQCPRRAWVLPRHGRHHHPQHPCVRRLLWLLRIHAPCTHAAWRKANPVGELRWWQCGRPRVLGVCVPGASPPIRARTRGDVRVVTVCCFGVLPVPRSWSSSSLACKLMPATRPSASTGASCTACARRWRRRASAGPSRASCRASLGLYLSTAPSSWRCRGRRVSSRTRASSGAPRGPPCCPLAHVGMPSSSLLLPCSCVAGVLLPRDRFLAAAATALDAVRWQQLGWRGWVGGRSAVASPC